MNDKIIAIDIGGTSIKGAVIDENKLIIKANQPTDIGKKSHSILGSLYMVIDRLLSDDVAGIAIASAGDINPYLGEVVCATDNLPGFTGVKLAKIVSDKYKVPCRAINDAHAAIFGEVKFGAGKDYSSVAMITLGTGVGGAFLKDGKVVFGKNFDAFRLGHLQLVEEGHSCNCGRKGCIEQYVSATALTKMITIDGHFKNPANLFEMMAQGDEKAVSLADKYLALLAKSLKIIKKETDCDCIIIGGGVTGSSNVWFERLRQLTDPKVNIAIAKLGNDAGLYGAKYWFENGDKL